MGKLARILKHRWHDETDARRALKPDALDRIEAKVAASERLHVGEIRVCIEAGLPMSYLWRDASARERAVAMFGKLGVWDTERNTGVLIYLLLAERQVEIVADRGIARELSGPEWEAVVDCMREPLRAGRFEQALIQAIDLLDAELVRHHPRREDDPPNRNELPNRPYMR